MKATAHCADTFKGCGESKVQVAADTGMQMLKNEIECLLTMIRGMRIIWKLSEMTFRKKERMIDEVSIL